MSARPFPAIALEPAAARGLLDAIGRRTVEQALDQAGRVIAAREATIEVLRLDPSASRARRRRGTFSAWLLPSRPTGDLDPALADQLAGTGLFLPGWYHDRYRDVVAGADPWAHFLSSGLGLGLAPNPFFDPDWYADTHLDGRRDEPAILHYLRVGARYALAPGPLFDAAAYLLAGAAPAGAPDALASFLTRGIDAGHAAIPVAARRLPA